MSALADSLPTLPNVPSSSMSDAESSADHSARVPAVRVSASQAATLTASPSVDPHADVRAYATPSVAFYSRPHSLSARSAPTASSAALSARPANAASVAPVDLAARMNQQFRQSNGVAVPNQIPPPFDPNDREFIGNLQRQLSYLQQFQAVSAAVAPRLQPQIPVPPSNNANVAVPIPELENNGVVASQLDSVRLVALNVQYLFNPYASRTILALTIIFLSSLVIAGVTLLITNWKPSPDCSLQWWLLVQTCRLFLTTVFTYWLALPTVQLNSALKTQLSSIELFIYRVGMVWLLVGMFMLRENECLTAQFSVLQSSCMIFFIASVIALIAPCSLLIMLFIFLPCMRYFAACTTFLVRIVSGESDPAILLRIVGIAESLSNADGNSILSIARRANSDAAQQQRTQLAQQLVARTTRVKALPLVLYSAGNGHMDQSTSCIICSEEFVGTDEIRVLPCEHHFHARCVDQWLINCQTTCPCCRFDVMTDLNPSSASHSIAEIAMSQ